MAMGTPHLYPERNLKASGSLQLINPQPVPQSRLSEAPCVGTTPKGENGRHARLKPNLSGVAVAHRECAGLLLCTPRVWRVSTYYILDSHTYSHGDSLPSQVRHLDTDSLFRFIPTVPQKTENIKKNIVDTEPCLYVCWKQCFN